MKYDLYNSLINIRVMKTKKSLKKQSSLFPLQYLVIGGMLMFSTSVFAQNMAINLTSLNNAKYIQDEKTETAVYVSNDVENVIPAASSTDYQTDLNDVVVIDNSTEDHLLIMAVNTNRKYLSTLVYNMNGQRVLHETPIEPGAYKVVEHAHDLIPGIYFLNILERGIVIEKQ